MGEGEFGVGLDLGMVMAAERSLLLLTFMFRQADCSNETRKLGWIPYRAMES